jgi:hypothetical protein
MTERELVLQELLGSLVPDRVEAAEWDDVLRRAEVGPRRVRRRPLVLALAALALAGLAVSPVGTAIADGVDGFAAWIRGEPGTPATPAEQQAFERANERTWAGFPPGTKLRRLIETEVSGTTFTLYGFRSGNDLCLRLVATGEKAATRTRCAPARSLQSNRAPAVVVATDEGIGTTHVRPDADGFVPPAYGATFGIASDGVSQVLLHGDDGTHRALLGGNAFLYVEDHPKLGTRIRSAHAVAADGTRAALPLQSAPYGSFDLPAPPKGQAPGPTRVEREIEGGSIGWVERGERRGETLPRSRIEPFLHGPGGRRQHLLLARTIQPDPDDYLRVGVVAVSPGSSLRDPASMLCAMTIDRNGAGGGCSPADRLFDRAPFTFGSSSFGGQYSELSGLASDDVARIELFPAHGEAFAVPLRDNAWLVRVAASDFPLRLVAYDDGGRVIGIHVEQSNGMTSPAPRAAQTSVRTVARVAGENGQTATLRAGRLVGGYRCWSIEVSGKGGASACNHPPSDEERALSYVTAEATHGDVFLTGELPAAVASVSVTSANGEAVRVKPINGFLVYAVPHRFVTGEHRFLSLRAYDARGTRIDTRGLSVAR